MTDSVNLCHKYP